MERCRAFSLARALVMAGALAASGGCAWLLGYDRLPQPTPPFRLRPDQATARYEGLAVDARFLGVGDRIATSLQPWGRVARAANPYGEDTLVFRLSFVNAGEHPASIQPSRATLAGDDGTPHASRTLDDFRRRWPTWAVDGPDQAADREAAIGYVLDTLLLDRLIESNAHGEGRVAFGLVRASRKLVLAVPARVGDESSSLVFTWEVF